MWDKVIPWSVYLKEQRVSKESLGTVKDTHN